MANTATWTYKANNTEKNFFKLNPPFVAFIALFSSSIFKYVCQIMNWEDSSSAIMAILQTNKTGKT